MPGVVYLICISSIACLAMGGSPGLALIGAIAWGVSLVLGGHFLNRRNLALVFVLNVVLLYGLSGSSPLFFGLVFFGIPSFLMGFRLSYGRGYYDLRKWGLGSAIISVMLFLGLSYYTADDIQIRTMQIEIEQYVQQKIDLPGNSEIWKLYEDQGISQEEIKERLANLPWVIYTHLPAFYCFEAILAVFIILSLSAFISRKKRLPILARRSFREEIMPWQFSWVIILALALWLWGRDEMNLLYYVGSNILLLAAPVNVYYGFSVLTYRWSKMQSRNKRWALILFVIMFLFLTIPAIIFIGLLGLFDSLLDYRKLRRKKEETN